MEYDFDGCVKVDPELILHNSDRIVVAAETPRFDMNGYRHHVLVLDRKEGLPIRALSIYGTWDADKLERMLDYEGTKNDRALKLRLASYIRNTEGLSFGEVSQAIASASENEDRLRQRWRDHRDSCAMMDDLEAREFSSYNWQFVLD